jgi:hypothetical protein
MADCDNLVSSVKFGFKKGNDLSLSQAEFLDGKLNHIGKVVNSTKVAVQK